ncbi:MULTISPECIES: UTRA domain-containing protein [unclassified Roseovarius]|uniref:UTRA domain-containing protein n=1 Tax=unclassified Roseovarius TaxID=2614913 RepID=UPI00273D567C|nr:MULTISPECIES: UTRA domain-containing protein [unclassified Roseovarius]
MSHQPFRNWQAIQAEVLRRIHAREWPPGHTIPNEADLAREFGCARATVNRALQSLADAGLLERRRKVGTRVALHPVGKATVDIPILRQEIEDRGLRYRYQLISRNVEAAPPHLRTEAAALHITALHWADEMPYVFEDRWIDTETAPDALEQSFDEISANEWLVTTAPYTHGDISFTAQPATGALTTWLNIPDNTPVFVIERTTWDRDAPITAVKLTYAPGYRIHTVIGTGPMAF